jgi:hypothetical protein
MDSKRFGRKLLLLNRCTTSPLSWRKRRKPRNISMNIFVHNDWVFGLCPSSGILETRKHNVSETESVSVLR